MKTTEDFIKIAHEAAPDLITKTAATLLAIEKIDPSFKEEVLNDFLSIGNFAKEKTASGVMERMAVAAGGTLVGAIGGAIAGDLYDAAKRGLSKASNYKRIMANNPSLKSADTAKVRAAFDMLHRYAPDFTADPTLGGVIMRQIIDLPELSNKTIMDVISARKNLADAKSKSFVAPLQTTIPSSIGKESPSRGEKKSEQS